MANQLKKSIEHPDFFDRDLPRLEEELGVKFDEFLVCLENVMKEIRKNPINNGSALCKFPPLLSFRKKPFFSKEIPVEGEKPDMRIVYAFNEKDNIIKFLAVGIRIKGKPRSEKDIYALAEKRDQTIL